MTENSIVLLQRLGFAGLNPTDAGDEASRERLPSRIMLRLALSQEQAENPVLPTPLTLQDLP